jgi:glutamyl-tRNA synthetase
MQKNSSSLPVRVRFAPSPTGNLHIGSLRSAIFNWLFARHHGGSFLLRVEDTDKERSLQEYTDSLLESLSWMGLIADELVVYQSEHEQRHRAVVQQLLSSGDAYYSYSPKDADDATQHEAPDGSSPETDGDNWVIRLRVPDVEQFAFDDMILGRISFDKEQVPDFVIARSDGSPTYNFVVVIDDLDMQITHIIRGQDHVSNTPKQLALYKVLGATAPIFAHIPLILGETGGKLSKRDAAVSVTDYQRNGILSKALCNYLVRLGWSHGDQEIFTTDELIEYFSIDAVGKSNAVFDMKKLLWVNAEYIKTATPIQLIEIIEHDVRPGWRATLSTWSDDQLVSLVALYQERVATLVELCDKLTGLYIKPTAYEVGDAFELNAELADRMQELVSVVREITSLSKETVKAALKVYTKQQGIKLGAIGQPLRVALTGNLSSPGIFDLIAMLGQGEVIDRLNRFVEYLQKI